MATIEIPVDANLDSQRLEMTLDGSIYSLKFYWNIRQQSWTMDILRGGNVLIQGIKIEPDWMPVFRYQIENFPVGDFIVYDTSGTGTPPERKEFGKDARVKLFYREAG